MSLKEVHRLSREKLNRLRKVSTNVAEDVRGEKGHDAKSQEERNKFAAVRKSSIVLRNELLFHEACMKNNLTAVKRLLDFKVDVNCKSHMSRTPLHWAVIHGDGQMIELLIKYKCDLEATDKFGTKAVLMAASLGHKDALQQLIKAGADLHATNKQNRGILHCAVENNHLEVMKYIIESLEHFDLDRVDKTNQTALHIAIDKGLNEAADMLIQNGSQLQIKDKLNQTPLHLAVINGNNEMSGKLLKLSVNVDDVDSEENTALHLAARGGHLETVILLLNQEANPNKTTLKKAWTPLHLAAHLGHTAIVQQLLERGADLQLQDQNGNSPLHLAISSNREETAAMLIKKNTNINSTNNRLQTPLHIAAEKGHSELVELLLVSGADVTAKDKNGRVPLSIAARGSFICIVDTIIKVDRANSTHQSSSEEANKPDIMKLNTAKTDPNYENIRQLIWQLATKQLKPNDWKKLAIHWKFSQEQIRAVEHQYIGEDSYKEHGYRMLLIWLSGLEDKNVITKEIYEALLEVGRKDLAESFRDSAEKQSSSRNSPKSICQSCYVL